MSDDTTRAPNEDLKNSDRYALGCELKRKSFLVL
jgi:hypothetical protein